jgi:hypothetical protein
MLVFLNNYSLNLVFTYYSIPVYRIIVLNKYYYWKELEERLEYLSHINESLKNKVNKKTEEFEATKIVLEKIDDILQEISTVSYFGFYNIILKIRSLSLLYIFL